jgi:hypothetical protein
MITSKSRGRPVSEWLVSQMWLPGAAGIRVATQHGGRPRSRCQRAAFLWFSKGF